MNISFAISKSSKNALTISPFDVRPGTSIILKYKKVGSIETTWNSNVIKSISIPNSGYCSPYSIKSPGVNIPWNYVVVDNDNHIFTAMPIDKGTIPITLYYWTWETTTIVTTSAVTSSSSTYYKDFLIDGRGYIIPKTIVPLPAEAIVSSDTYEVTSKEDYLVTAEIAVAGITYYQDEPMTSTSNGTIRGKLDTNLFRVGITEVVVPTDIGNYTERPLKWVVGPYKTSNQITGLRVIIDDQTWSGSLKSIRGILTIDRYFYVMTSTGLYQFLHDTYFDYSEKNWPTIIGNDITYDDENNICVATFKNNMACIEKHKILSGIIYNDGKSLYKREDATVVNYEQ